MQVVRLNILWKEGRLQALNALYQMSTGMMPVYPV